MALVGNISGSSQNSSNIGISGSVVIANRPDATFPTLAGVGGDVVFFVSGTRGGKGNTAERTVSVFGGDAVVSGSLTIGTGSITITSNDITFQGGAAQIYSGSGGLTFVDSGAGPITLAQIVAGSTAQPAYWTSVTANEIYTTGSAVASGSIKVKDGTGATVVSLSTGGVISGSSDFQVGGNLTIAGNIDSDVDEDKSIFSSVTSKTITIGASTNSTVLIPGNLTVNGTTTTVNTTNLVVKDPLIYMASASAAGTVAYGGIAIASGSGVTNQALVFVKDTNGTEAVWSSGRQDVNSGSETTNSGLTYLPIRASKFEVGGTLGGTNSVFLTSSDGSNAILKASTILTLSSSANQAVDVSFGGSQFATIAPIGTDVKLGAAAGKNLQLSGSQVIVRTDPGPTKGFLMQVDTTPLLSIVSGSSTNLITIKGEQTNNTLDLFHTNSTTVRFAGAATGLSIGNTVTAGQTVNLATGATSTGNTKAINVGTGGLAGSTTNISLGSSAGTTLIAASGSLEPGSDVTFDLGSPTKRWRNMYTGDLHLRNERGDYTLIEEEDFLSIRFNKTGKRYKFVLEPVPELDEK